MKKDIEVRKHSRKTQSGRTTVRRHTRKNNMHDKQNTASRACETVDLYDLVDSFKVDDNEILIDADSDVDRFVGIEYKDKFYLVKKCKEGLGWHYFEEFDTLDELKQEFGSVETFFEWEEIEYEVTTSPRVDY